MNQPTTPNTVEDFLPLPKPIGEVRTGGLSVENAYTADQVRAAILADRAQRAATDIEPHMKRCDEMRDALCECKDKLRAATEQIEESYCDGYAAGRASCQGLYMPEASMKGNK